ncbi:hypothetical protein C1646_731652 [Rhizophagus diaphanus]|nr:hypothetical protein C1646_731652 [Rhizophagus diaphanus] [Rhizophagus sp. MUCL 43196]
MELLGDLFENEQRIGNSIRNVPTTLNIMLKERERERRGRLDSKLETGIFENGNRRSDDPSCHSMGCSYPPLYDQHWRTSNADFSRLSDGMAEIMKVSFGASVIGNRDARNQIIKFREKVDLENHHLFPQGRSWEFELHNDHETQNTHDLASLIKLLKDKEPYRDETNKDVLFDYEIQFFAETYGITDFLLVFACGDWVFWLEDHGVIYFWSRIDDSMIRGGKNLKEALMNYLFNQENLCYVDEITRKLVPINAYDK